MKKQLEAGELKLPRGALGLASFARERADREAQANSGAVSQ